MSWLKKIAFPTFYHGTDSPPFDNYDPKQRTKSEKHYNPLGEGMYATNHPGLAEFFGKNVYQVRVPDNCKIKRFSPNQARSAISDIIRKSLSAAGTAPRHWTPQFMRDLNETLDLAKESPYDAVYECMRLASDYFQHDLHEFANIVGQIATQKFSKYDAVIFNGTSNPDPNDIMVGDCPLQEVIIFNPAFQKVFNGEIS